VRQYGIFRRILDAAPSTRTFTVGNMNPLHTDRQEEIAAHLFEMTSVRHFGKEQLADSFGQECHFQQMQFAGASDGT
jgi:hypothetical protein